MGRVEKTGEDVEKKKEKRGKKKKDVKEEALPTEGWQDVELNLDDYTVIGLYSPGDLLRALTEFINDVSPEIRYEYEEDHFWTDVRIGLGCICSAIALYAWFGTKLPDDREITLACVVGYFFFSCCIYYLDVSIIRNTAICLRRKDGSRLHIEVSMPNFSPEPEGPEICIELRTNTGLSHSASKGVSAYFDKEGYLDQAAFFADLKNLVIAIEEPEEAAKSLQEGKEEEPKKDK